MTGGTKWWKWVMSREADISKVAHGGMVGENHFATDMGGWLDGGSTFLRSLEVEVRKRNARR